jgi:hypothetical protein
VVERQRNLTLKSAVWPQCDRQFTKLFRVQVEQDEVLLTLVAEGAFPKEVLDSTQCFILDCVSEVFPWTGKKAPVALRNATSMHMHNDAAALSHTRAIALIKQTMSIASEQGQSTRSRTAILGIGSEPPTRRWRNSDLQREVPELELIVADRCWPNSRCEESRTDDGQGMHRRTRTRTRTTDIRCNTVGVFQHGQ